MSNSATEDGKSGQESGAVEGKEGTGQESVVDQNGKSGQEPGAEGTQSAAFDPETITDPAVKAWAVKVAKDAKEAREEAAKHRVALRDRETEIQRQNESDTERQTREAQEAAQRLESLEQENRSLKVNGAVEKAATEAKAHNPATVLGLIAPKVVLDDAGNPSNLQTLLTDLRKSDPYLFKAGKADAGEGTGDDDTPTGGSMNDLIRRHANARKGR